MENKATECIQNIRPISNVLDKICDFTKEANLSKFRLIFGEIEGHKYFELFTKHHHNFCSFFKSLSPIERSRLGNYIEAMTPRYDVLDYVEDEDIDRFIAADNLILSTIVRDVNWCKYAGNLDENEILIWVSNEKKRLGKRQ